MATVTQISESVERVCGYLEALPHMGGLDQEQIHRIMSHQKGDHALYVSDLKVLLEALGVDL